MINLCYLFVSMLPFAQLWVECLLRLTLPHSIPITCESLLFWGYGVTLWTAFQWILYIYPNLLGVLLSKVGYKYSKDTNGLQSWIISMALCGYLFHYSRLAPVLLNNLYSVYIVCSLGGFAMSIVFYFRGPRDGNKMYDFIMGQELHPLFGGKNVKLFFNGRPGIIGWSVLNLAGLYYHYHTFGVVSKTLVYLNFMQGLYVVDFFWNEQWYLGTIDMMHDKFGFYLAWGDCVWLPFTYTLQGIYLAQNVTTPVFVGYEECCVLLCLIGYAIFRTANMQKDRFRQNHSCLINGNPVKYMSGLNKEGHQSHLLLSGVWGWARHVNYSGDLLMALSYGLITGFDSLVPYWYFVFMIILLVGRCYRDECRCEDKYGSLWRDYMERVPYRLIKYVY